MNLEQNFLKLTCDSMDIRLEPGESSLPLPVEEDDSVLIVVIFEGHCAFYSGNIFCKNLKKGTHSYSDLGVIESRMFKNETSNFPFLAKILKIKKPS